MSEEMGLLKRVLQILIPFLYISTVYAQTGPQVSIRTSPPGPPFPVAIWIFFSCDITSLHVHSVTYEWTGHCITHGTDQVVFRFPNRVDSGVFSLRVKSSPLSCVTTVVCTATDIFGNTQRASVNITSVTGVGFFGTSQPISNNSVFTANATGHIGTIYCHSASRASHIGRWISPYGRDITFVDTDSFQIRSFSGPYPSYTTFKLEGGSTFTAAEQGIYSCVIPDETGTEQTLNVWVYPDGNQPAQLEIISIRRTSENPITISCSTSGLPLTSVSWYKGAQELTSGSAYTVSQPILHDRRNTTYSAILTINVPLVGATGVYSCIAHSEISGLATQSRPGLSNQRATPIAARQFFAIYIVGESPSIRFTILNATRIELLRDNMVILTSTSSPFILSLSANESIHHQLYVCRGYRLTEIVEINVTVIIQVPDYVLAVTIPPEDGSLGERRTLTCIASETVEGLTNRATAQWLDQDGNVINSGAGIVVDGPTIRSTVTTISLTFDSLKTSHAGSYTCQATLSSPTLSLPLVKTAQTNVTVQVPAPTVFINTPSSGPLYAGSALTLTCLIQVDATVDTPVNINAGWRKNGASVRDNRITTSSTQQISSHTYRQTLTISSLSKNTDTGDYSCTASISSNPPSPFITGPSETTVATHSITQIRAVIVAITAEGPETVGETLTLACTATEEEDLMGTLQVTWLDQMGQPLSPAGDVSVGGPTIVGNTVTLTLTFNPLKVSHDGQYTCQATVEGTGVTESATHDVVVSVQALRVTITSTSTEYSAASPLTLTCGVPSGASEPVTFQWSSTCSGSCFVNGQTSALVMQTALHSIDSGVHTCTATDSVGNTGNASVEIRVVGVGLYSSSSGQIANNSIITASSDGSVDPLECISGSTSPGVGRWMDPNGQDITFQSGDDFDVTVGGQENPGYVRLSLSQVTPSNQGVYTCVISDENGAEQTIHVGIYPRDFSAPTSIVSVGQLPPAGSLFTLNCTSTGSPATNVSWTLDNRPISAGGIYQMVQVLRDRSTGTYDNLLVVDANPDDLIGTYSCIVRNAIGTFTETLMVSGLQVLWHPDVFLVGESRGIRCLSDLHVTSIEWLYGGLVVALSNSHGLQHLDLQFNPVNDSISNREYTCRVTSPYGIQEHTITLLVEVVPENFNVTIEINATDFASAGQSITLTCTVTTSQGLQYPPSLQWLDSTGSNVASGGGISLEEPVRNTADSTTTLVLLFSPLRFSHGGEFTCRANISSPAPPYSLSKLAEWDLIVGTTCTRIFQLFLREVHDCAEWRFEDTGEKLSDIIGSVTTGVAENCQCPIAQHLIDSGEFLCTNEDSHVVVFRARITGNVENECTQLLSHIEEWVEEKLATVLIQSNRLSVNSSCMIEIQSVSDPVNCIQVLTAEPTDGSTGKKKGGGTGAAAIGAGVGGAVGATVVVIIIVVTILCYIRVARRNEQRRLWTTGPNQAYGNVGECAENTEGPYSYICDNKTYEMKTPRPPLPLRPLERDRTESVSSEYVTMKSVTVSMQGAENEKLEPLYEYIDPPQEWSSADEKMHSTFCH